MPRFGSTRAGKALGVHSCQRREHQCWRAGNLIFRYYVKKKKGTHLVMSSWSWAVQHMWQYWRAERCGERGRSCFHCVLAWWSLAYFWKTESAFEETYLCGLMATRAEDPMLA